MILKREIHPYQIEEITFPSNRKINNILKPNTNSSPIQKELQLQINEYTRKE